MSLSRSNFQTSSPSFPSVQQVSGDIFFQVKKQILDKLDIILQKVNLQVIEYLKPQDERKQAKKQFRFIELSSFQNQIQTLFDYLDRLYESLNASVSFSSNDINNTLNNTESNKHKSINQFNSVLVNEINEIKAKFQNLGEETIRLRQQNEHMKFLLKNNFSNSVSLGQSINQQSKSSLKNYRNQHKNRVEVKPPKQESGFQSLQFEKQQNAVSMQGISLQTVKKILRFYNHSIRQLSLEYKQNVKEMKKTLKQYKFQLIQNRVQCIAELKKFAEKGQGQSETKKDQISTQNIGSKNTKISSIVQNNSIKQSRQQQAIQQNCSSNCFQQYYLASDDKNGFQQDLLQKIQQILDVC